MNIHWRDWQWSWSSNILATWCEDLTHLKRPWCWERKKRGWQRMRWLDGITDATQTQWTWVWVNSGSCQWTGRLACCSPRGCKESDTTERLNWTDYTDFRWQMMSSLLFNMLTRLVIAFLPRSKHLLILWLQSPSTAILEPKKIKSDTVSTFSPSIYREVRVCWSLLLHSLPHL